MNLFDKSIIGVTAEKNDSPELKDMMQKFRIYATKIEYELDDVMTDEDKEKKKKLREKGIEKFKNSYTIDHTVLTYLMDD